MFLLQVPAETRFFGFEDMKATGYNEGLFRQLLDYKPDVTIILLGANDISTVSVPRDIAGSISDMKHRLEQNSYVFYVPIFERGNSGEIGLTKAIFNAQRKKINKILSKEMPCVNVKDVRLYKHYLDDKVHLNKSGEIKLFHSVRRTICSVRF